MAKEIERKFLVNPVLWNQSAKESGEFYAQGYLCSDKERTVRVRVTPHTAYLTIKGRPAENSFARSEFEYEVPVVDARAMLAELCTHALEKTRYEVQVGEHLWEVDEFHGENFPLLMAEIELSSEEESFILPEWVTEERTQDFRYSNSYLAKHPYSTWSEPR